MTNPTAIALVRPLPAASADVVRQATLRASGLAAELRRLQAELSGRIGMSAGWSGPAELAFQQSVAAELYRLTPAAQRFEEAAAALSDYARELDWLEPRLRQERSALPDVGHRYEQSWNSWDAARDRAASRLAAAGQIGADPHRSGWSRFSAAVRHTVPHISLAEVSHALSGLSTALVGAGLVLSLVCPPAAGVVWAATAAVAACQLAVDVVRRERGERVGWGQLGLDLAGVLPAGGMLRGVGSAAEASAAIDRLPQGLRSSRLVPGGGLAAHEGSATFRGHTLLKHVGKSPRQLARRIAQEPETHVSSSFTDRPTAEAAIAKLMEDKQHNISEWLAQPSYPLELDGRHPTEVGITMRRHGEAVSTNAFRVVLFRDDSPLGYYIRTAYPRIAP